MEKIQRPIISVEYFENALKKSRLNKEEQELIEFIRYIGVFSQPSLVRDLRLKPKPPVLSILCEACRKIGNEMP